jgi:hypothetical protein
LQTKFVGLTQIRIFLDTHSLGGIKKLPKDMEGKTEEEKKRYIYASMIHMESMIESKERLEVFEIHIDHWTYPYLKERIKPWLKQKEEERKIMRKMDGIRYKAYKCRNSTIICQGGVMDCEIISNGSSQLGLEDSKSVCNDFWRKKVKEYCKK